MLQTNHLIGIHLVHHSAWNIAVQHLSRLTHHIFGETWRTCMRCQAQQPILYCSSISPTENIIGGPQETRLKVAHGKQ